MNFPLVSVIIAVYNVEKYLERCLTSVMNQTLHDIEILCIDDCSTDSSRSLCERFSKKRFSHKSDCFGKTLRSGGGKEQGA